MKRKDYMTEKEFRETDWKKVFKDFAKLSPKEQTKIQRKAMKGL